MRQGKTSFNASTLGDGIDVIQGVQRIGRSANRGNFVDYRTANRGSELDEALDHRGIYFVGVVAEQGLQFPVVGQIGIGPFFQHLLPQSLEFCGQLHGIQAIDLLLRKLPLGGGAVVDDLLAQVEKEAGDTPALAATRNALGYLRAATTEGRMLDALAGATPFLRMVGNVLGDWLLQRGANAARSLLDAGTGDAEFLKRRVAVADFFRTRILPTTVGLEPVVGVGHDGLAEVF